MKFIFGFIVYLLAFVTQVAVCTLLTYVVCWAFSIPFQLQYGLGVFILIMLWRMFVEE